jgi:amino acid transporter
LYVSVAAVSVLVVPPSELGSSSAPLSLVFDRSGGSGEALALVALAAMLNGALVQIIMSSRILFSLARKGPLPSWLGVINKARQTPIRATLCVTSLVFLFAVALPLESLASATAGIALAVFTLVNASLFVLRMRSRQSGSSADDLVPIWIPLLGALFSFGLLLFEIARRLA